MLHSPSCDMAFALCRWTTPGGRHDDLSKMQRLDGERVAAGFLTGVHGVSLYQLRPDLGSADRAESSRTTSDEPASPRCSVNVGESQQACSVATDDLPLRPDPGGVDVAFMARPKTLPTRTYDLRGLSLAVAQRPPLP